jgi:Zn ribbon nucleic-acid-binding protein
MIIEPDKTDGIIPESPKKSGNLFEEYGMLDLTHNYFTIGWYCPNCEMANGMSVKKYLIKGENGDRIECDVRCGFTTDHEGNEFDTESGCGETYHFKTDVEYFPRIKNIEFLEKEK